MAASLDGRIVVDGWLRRRRAPRRRRRTRACGRAGMLRAGLIDEVSLLVSPVVDGRIGTPSLFDVVGDDVAPRKVALEEIERRADDILWLRYRVASA
jgi:hypothetical protein